MVHIFTNGAIGDAPAGQSDLRRFKFEKPKEAVVDATSKKIATLGEFIKTTSADKLYAHASLAAKGVPPAVFAVQKSMCYTAAGGSASEETAAIKCASESQKLNLLWAVACVVGQIVMKKGEDFVLK